MSDLLSTYELLSKRYGETTPTTPPATKQSSVAFRSQLSKESDRMREECCRRILLDIYIRTLPLDDDYIKGHRGMLKGDIDRMLDSKGMTAIQYFQSAYGETKAPLLEYVLRSINAVVSDFREEVEESRREAEERKMDAPSAKVEEEDIESAIVDITSDTEYETFINTLKKRTADRIVKDISKLIEDKDDEVNMTFNPKTDDAKTESTSPFTVIMNYATKSAMRTNPDASVSNDGVIGMAIRESCLYTIGMVMGIENANMRHLESHLNLGKGIVVTESAVAGIVRSPGF